MRFFPYWTLTLTLLALPREACSQVVSTGQSSYSVGEPIDIEWTLSNRDAKDGDWIGLYNTGVLSSGELSSSSLMWVYAKSLTQTYSKGKQGSGSVTFDANPPDETGLVAWPLGEGTYQVHIIRDAAFPPYTVVASSSEITVTNGGPPPVTTTTTTTTIATTTPAATTSVTSSKTAYSSGEDIVVDFAYPTNPGLDAWIGIWPADSDPASLPSPSSLWNYICSDSQSSSCATHPTAGGTTLNVDSVGGAAWPLTCGTFRAFLIPSGASASYYSSEAASGEFTVGPPTCENVTTTTTTTTITTTTPAATTSVTSSKTAYSSGEDIVVDFVYPTNPGLDAWIGIWPADSDPASLPSPSSLWNYICSDSQSSSCAAHPTAGGTTLNVDSAGGAAWPLTCGTFRAFLIPSGASASYYNSEASSGEFTVGSPPCENQVCNAAPQDPNPVFTHLVPSEGAMISNVAFGSCYSPSSQSGPDLWQHVRTNFGSNSVFNWLGDNMYGR